MVFFFDTNVCIGYIFKWDPWHSKSNELFSKDENSYWSQTVKEEVFNLFNKLVEVYLNFLDNLKKEIINHNIDVFKINDLLKLANKVTIQKNRQKDMINKNIIVNSIWDENGWYEVTKDDLVHYLDKILIDYIKIHFEKFNKCGNALVLTSKTDNYEDLKNIFINDNLHYPDWQICLDAHDLACKIENLVFVTADYDLIKCLEPILSKTNITSILKLDNLAIFS
ncbi:MAG: hypothetical protein LBR24_01380 [Methanobrevibacter sp.]|jgi:predicted nucleic acid-binding protein|nr:hypothetical protein [Methanobrevibacter sp.]